MSKTETDNTSVIDRLKKRKAELDKPVTVTLPETAETVTYPGFVSHGSIMQIYKKAGGQKGTAKMAAIAISELCRFGSEQARLSHTDVTELLPNRDVTFLSSKCLGVEEEDEEGNEFGE
jgi:hypothetical protein